jgi:hypothetical protein
MIRFLKNEKSLTLRKPKHLKMLTKTKGENTCLQIVDTDNMR